MRGERGVFIGDFLRWNQRSDTGQEMPLGWTEQSVITDLVGSPGEHVLEKPAKELKGVQGHDLPRAVPGILVPEGDGPVIHGEDSAVGDGDTMYVPGQVLEDLLRTLNSRLAVDDPVVFPDRFREAHLG
jgi:hypothetical protein